MSALKRAAVGENLLLYALTQAGLNGAVTDFEKAFDAADFLALMIADMIGPDGDDKNGAFAAALVIGGKK